MQVRCLAYGERPALLAELAILENGEAADLLQFLSASREMLLTTIHEVLLKGGLFDLRGEFVVLFIP